MDFRLSGEQEMLRDSARRYLLAEQSFENRQQEAKDYRGNWEQLSELGWLALAVPEDLGGLGSGVEDLAILGEEMGRALSLDPFVGCGVLPTRIIDRIDRADKREQVLAQIAGNETRIAVALYEPGRRYDLSAAGMLAARTDDGAYRLHGTKILVSGGAGANQLIVSAQIRDRATEPGGPALFLVDAKLSGIACHAYQAIDDSSVADFTFDEVEVPADALLAVSGGALLEDAVDDAIVCLCAEALGGMEKAIEMTADYLKLRAQFGRPLAEFQVLQHTVAEMFIEASDARSMLYRALATLPASGAERRKAVSACKVKIMEAAKWVAGTAVHLHGGIGVTCEYPVGHYLRRVLVSERSFGDNAYHLERYLSEKNDKRYQ
ncbi:acyl-CoA dehydrogenase family protein [Massilia niabensis]|uniref:Acyl-CoA dehydrogenase family protein n=1 Tax=Massilia niabensis TaxID=544910 RepID=A0ABW0LCH0_9BURK